MNKHFMITVSDDRNALYGAQFACHFFGQKADHHITLLHLCATENDSMNQVLTELWQDPEERLNGKLSPKAKKALDKAMQMIEQSDFSLDRIGVKTAPEKYGLVKDLLEEGNRGVYDAILLGRKATYSLQWLFERAADEIPQAVIRNSGFSSPVWICPEPCMNRKNVLACVDGSANGYRVIDHVGFVLSDQPQHDVTIMHVEKGGRGNSEEIFQRSIEILTRHGISRDRITIRSAWGLSVAGTVLAEVEKHKFAAVSIGLHGLRDRSVPGLEKLAGETAGKIIRKIEKTSLWCVP